MGEISSFGFDKVAIKLSLRPEKYAGTLETWDRAEEGLREALDIHARAGLAGYKIPRLYLLTDTSLRLNNGKPDYKTAQALADAAVS